MAPNFDNLTLLPSSKILYYSEKKLQFSATSLKQLINSYKQLYREANPSVSVLSILGSPSNEKYLLARSFIKQYEVVRGKQQPLIDDKQKQAGGGDPDERAVYLLNKPFLVGSGKDEKLVWIFYLNRGKNGEEDGVVQLMERFLLLVSSRIAEVKFDDEQVQILQQWLQLEEHVAKLKSPPVTLCNSYLYLFPCQDFESGSQQHPDFLLHKKEEAKAKLSVKIQPTSGSSQSHSEEDRIASIMHKLEHIDLIEMKAETVSKELFRDNNIVQKDKQASLTLRNISSALQNISPAVQKTSGQKGGVQLGSFFDFVKENVDYVNNTTAALPSLIFVPGKKPESVQKLLPSILVNRQESNNKPKPSEEVRVKTSSKVKFHVEPISENPEANMAAAGAKADDKIPPEGNKSRQQSQEPLEEAPITKDMNTPEEKQVETPVVTPVEPKTPLQTSPKQVSHEADDEALAMKLTRKVLTFYNEEMQRYLEDDIYRPKVLEKIHTTLSTALISELKTWVGDSRVEKMEDSLDMGFLPHCEKNTANLKRKQAAISKLLQTMVSSYMERIEGVLAQRESGMPKEKLNDQHNQIVEELAGALRKEIISAIRRNEPLSDHVNSLRVEVDEYWEYVSERNDDNFKRRKLNEQLADVRKRQRDDTWMSSMNPEWDQFKVEYDIAQNVANNQNSKLEEIEKQMKIALGWYGKYGREASKQQSRVRK